MIKFDHRGINVKSLDEAIKFYSKIGFRVISIFNDDEYRWATLEGPINYELFECSSDKVESHDAFSYDDTSEIKSFIGNQKPFYGDTKRESYTIKDNSGNVIQFIKK